MGNYLCLKPATKDEVTTLNTREAPPAHFMIKIESFSVLEKYGIKKYETKEFVATITSGCLNLYRRLIFKFNGKDSDYISVNLAMADTTSLPTNWEVNALFSVFIFNQISGNYLSSTGRTLCFQATKSEWGISKLISRKVLSDPSNGYIIDDRCVFGAEVFVVKREAAIERVLLTNVNTYYNHALEILGFSQLPQRWVSEEFDAGGQKWKILLYPKGNAEGTGSHFSASSSSWGRPVYIDLATINDPNKGFIVKYCCLLNIEINVKAVAHVS
ncbi:hypothetical protein MIMGU_mgv1a017793mg [Erythranthe guttata]|uniref:MATH domain-containing protein n=1 Tax=Erythranthe guttata TaxID=4155 RepID=A0A022QGF8_ERYGU|nr:hypothetical protein MIMGU_mgv1a017793mg [Erythranthe guttata]